MLKDYALGASLAILLVLMAGSGYAVFYAGENIDLLGSKIINLGTPTADGDLATKDYVDGLTGGSPWSMGTGTIYNTTANVNIGGTTDPGVALEVQGDITSKGTKWENQTAAEASGWNAVTYGDGLYVAVATSGTNRIMTSPDGITWTAKSEPEANIWRDVTYGNGMFVGVAQSGTYKIMTSTDGISWTNRTAPSAQQYRGVTYGEGLFVSVSSLGPVMTSPDGINWTERTAANEASNWRRVAYGKGTFVAVADSGTYRVMTSPDGITWSNRTAADAKSWWDVTYGNGQFVAVGTGAVMTSPDGITWSNQTPTNTTTVWNGITYGHGLLVATGSSGQLMTSPDGITWTERTTPEVNTWNDVTYGNGRFVAVASSGTYRVMTSGQPYAHVIPKNNTYQGGMKIYGNVTLNHDLTLNKTINQTETDGNVRTFSNGCIEKINSTGYYKLCS